MYQCMVADIQITDGTLQGEGDDIRTGYDINYQQVWDHLDVATELMSQDEDAYNSMTYSFLAEKNGITADTDEDGYLEDTRTFSEVVETFKSELTALYDAYDPVARTGDYNAQMTNFDNCEGYINNVKDFIDMYAVYQLDVLADQNASMLKAIYAIAVIMLILILVIIISVIVIRGILRGVRITKENMKQLADRNLAFEPKQVKGADEIAQMCDASVKLFKSQNDILGLINEASEKINEVSSSLNTSSHDVQNITDEIVVAIRDMAGLMSEQADETSHASEESKVLGDIVISSNQSAETLASVSGEIGEITSESAAFVQTSMNDMTGIAADIKKLADELQGILTEFRF